MLGLADGYVAAAYILCLLCAGLCVAYGLINWNRGGETTIDTEETRWAQEETRIDEEL